MDKIKTKITDLTSVLDREKDKELKKEASKFIDQGTAEDTRFTN